MSRSTGHDFRYKSIRDPLYGFVGLSREETKLIDTDIFGRLRRIKQLSHAYVAYPSAVHTRFEHSLGVAHIAGRMCDELDLDVGQKRLVRMAALLHDVGHGPFSHLFEHVLRWTNPGMSDIHERITRLIVEEDGEIGDILGDDRRRIVDLLDGRADTTGDIREFSLLSQIISSGLDADRLDYLRRDSYHVGAAYGTFDLERILYTLRRTPGREPLLAVDAKSAGAVENYRIARYLMHALVYGHHAHLAADRMFLHAMHAAIYDEGIIDRNRLRMDSPGRFLPFYRGLDDDSVNDLVINDPKAGLSREILNQIRRRRLLKRSCQFRVQRTLPLRDAGQAGEMQRLRSKKRIVEMQQRELDSVAAEVAGDLGLGVHEVVLHRFDTETKLFGEMDILLLDDGQVHDMKAMSSISAHVGYVKFYAFGPEDGAVRKRIAQKIAERLGIDASVLGLAADRAP